MDTSNVMMEEILRMLPHRYPFLLVDRVVDIVPGESCVGIKNVTANEPQFMGHFPGNPVFPGVLLIEAMAQTSAIFVCRTLDFADKDMGVFFLTIDNTKFRRVVQPGDQLRMHMTVTRPGGKVWKFHGEAMVDGQKVCETDISAMIQAAKTD